MVFFDSNPIGRITSRFSRDMTVIDRSLPSLTIHVTQGLLRTITVIASVSFINPVLLIFASIGAWLMTRVYKYGIRGMIDAQRID